VAISRFALNNRQSSAEERLAGSDRSQDSCGRLNPSLRWHGISQVVGRAAALFLLGMFLQGGVPGHFATFDLATVRVMGILQRIARASCMFLAETQSSVVRAPSCAELFTRQNKIPSASKPRSPLAVVSEASQQVSKV